MSDEKVCEECRAPWDPRPSRPGQCGVCGNRTWVEHGPAKSVVLRAEAERQRELDHHRKESIIQHPETGDFLRGALVEAAYQREAWPDQDQAKSDSDWFWTLGYIVGKATKEHDAERQLHHIEAGAALLANWHNAVKGRG